MKTLKITKDRIIINGAHFFHDEIDSIALSIKDGKTTLFILTDDYGHEYEVNDFLEEVLNYINDFHRKDFSTYNTKATKMTIHLDGTRRILKIYHDNDVIDEQQFWELNIANNLLEDFLSSLNLQDYL